jgi:hypothetical protein
MYTLNMDFMYNTFGSAWAYYVAFVIAFAWWLIERNARKKKDD